MAEVDTSIYKNAISQNPMDVATKATELQNKLLGNVQSRQAIEQGDQTIQANNIKLATERFGLINNAASGLLSDPDLGKADLTKKLTDTLGRLTADDAMTAQHAVQFLQQFPKDPAGQRQAIQAVHSQTLGAWEKGKAYLGETQGMDVGGGTKFIRAPAFGGNGPPQDLGFVPHTVPATTPITRPDLSKDFAGGAGNPTIQPPAGNALGVPAPNAGAPVVAPRGPSAAPIVAPQGALKAAAAPGQAAAAEKTGIASGEMLAGERARAANYRREVYPLEQAIPALERLGKTGTGPGTEQVNQIKSFLQSAGVPGVDVKKIKDYDEAHKYLTDWVTANGDSSTNDKLAAAFSSNASTKISNAAAVDVAKAALSLRKMKQAQLEEFQATGKSDDQYGKWASEWNRKQDPRVYGWDYMNDAQRKNMLSSVTGPKRDMMIMQLHQAAENGLIDPNSLTPSKK